MADAADGKFDVVLVYHTSRFARNQVEARRYKQLRRAARYPCRVGHAADG
jgi:DNA invertase Pin-like site-specific DNA recombinase